VHLKFDPVAILYSNRSLNAYLTEPLEIFLNSVGSKETRRQYKKKLEHFLDFIKLEGDLNDRAKKFIDIGKTNKDSAFQCIVQFIAYQKMRCDNKEITAGTLRNYFKPIKIFCETNDISLNWKKITRGFPKSRKFAQDRAPTTEEIRRLINYPDRRIKPIVFTMAASGIRVGAWDWLKWGHINPMYNEKKEVIAAKIIVYAGEIEQYTTFITPEAYQSLKEWIDLRKEHGEKIGPNSWVMRDIFRTTSLKYGAHYGLASAPKQLKSSGIRTMLKRAWIAQGLAKESNGGNFDFKSSHGFRKRFKTQCELAGLRPLNVECMLGHDTGIAGSSYYRPTDQDLLNDYLKAISSLQVSEVAQFKQELVQNEKKFQNEIGDMKAMVESLQNQVTYLSSSVLSAKVRVLQEGHQGQDHS